MKTDWEGRVIRTALVLLASISQGCRVIESRIPGSKVKPTEVAATSRPAPTATATSMPPTPTDRPPDTETPGLTGMYGPFAIVSPVPPDAAVLDVRAAPDGALWLSTDAGLSVLRAGSWAHLGGAQAMVLGFDAASRAWTADESGDRVTVWSGSASRTMGVESGWSAAGRISQARPYATVNDRLVTDGRGWSWLVTRHDIRVFDGEVWRVFSSAEAGFAPSTEMVDMGVEPRLRDVAVDSVGDVWVTDCTWGGPGPLGFGARWYDGTAWEGQTSSVVGSGCIEAIEVDGVGRVWLGIDGDLWCYTPGQGWEEFAHPDVALPQDTRWGYIVDLVLGGDGEVWVTMAPCGGASCDVGLFQLFHVREGSWTHLDLSQSGGETAWVDLALDQQGKGWACAGNTLYEVVGGAMTPVYASGDFACRLERGSSGDTWLWQPGLTGLWVTR